MRKGKRIRQKLEEGGAGRLLMEERRGRGRKIQVKAGGGEMSREKVNFIFYYLNIPEKSRSPFSSDTQGPAWHASRQGMRPAQLSTLSKNGRFSFFAT